MPKQVRISIDAMGGDHGPSVVIPGAAEALERHPDASFVIYGQESAVMPVLDKHPKLKQRSIFHHCDVVVQMDDKPEPGSAQGALEVIDVARH